MSINFDYEFSHIEWILKETSSTDSKPAERQFTKNWSAKGIIKRKLLHSGNIPEQSEENWWSHSFERNFYHLKYFMSLAVIWYNNADITI